MESNDSSEIPDRGETSDIPGLPSGGLTKVNMRNYSLKKGEHAEKKDKTERITGLGRRRRKEIVKRN